MIRTSESVKFRCSLASGSAVALFPASGMSQSSSPRLAAFVSASPLTLALLFSLLESPGDRRRSIPGVPVGQSHWQFIPMLTGLKLRVFNGIDIHGLARQLRDLLGRFHSLHRQLGTKAYDRPEVWALCWVDGHRTEITSVQPSSVLR